MVVFASLLYHYLSLDLLQWKSNLMVSQYKMNFVKVILLLYFYENLEGKK